MARCNIYYNKYNIVAKAYIPHIKVVETEDVYHEIGMLICRSIERIKNIRYTTPKASRKECEEFWEKHGYRKLTEDLWIMDCIKEKK